MFAIVENNQVVRTLSDDEAFTLNEIQYPSNWLRTSSLQEKAFRNIVSVEEGAKADERYYWIGSGAFELVENVWTRTYSATPKDLAALKIQATTDVKRRAGATLALTDWYIVRQAEGGSSTPAEILAARQALRSAANLKETAIMAAADVPALESILKTE